MALALCIASFAFATGASEQATATDGEFIIGNGAEPIPGVAERLTISSDGVDITTQTFGVSVLRLHRSA